MTLVEFPALRACPGGCGPAELFLGATWGDLHAFEHDDIRSWRRQALAFVGDLSVSQLVETNEMQSLTLPSSTAFLAGSEWMMLVTVVGAAVATLMLPAGAKS
jgi:hypothetical protein